MSYCHFTQEERYILSVLLKKDFSRKVIARELNRNPSSISREIKRNSTKGIYNPAKAQHKAYYRRKYSKYIAMKIVEHPELEKYIQTNLKRYWTPDEIAGRWNGENHLDQNGHIITISAVIIYKYLYHYPGGYHYCRYLLSCRQNVRKRKDKKKLKRQFIPDRVSIHDRPISIENREEFGHFEGDTLGRVKTDSEVITGLVERKSRYLLIEKIDRLKHTIESFNNLLKPYQSVIQSITLDNGVENVRHRKLNTSVYFCDPYSSWQKGSVENSFKRLRRFIPKKSSLKFLSKKDITHYVNIMNNTPRKCLNYRTPKEVFQSEIKALANPV